jgi:polysaccharide export outer membrane protein
MRQRLRSLAAHRVPTLGLLAVATLLLQGCALSPGLVVDAKTAAHPKVDNSLTATPVTVEVVAALRAEHDRAPAPVDLPPGAEPFVYRLGSQDRLHISVWNHPDLGSGQQGNLALPSSGIQSGPSAPINPSTASDRLVDDSGTVFVPLVGKVPAAGLTVAEFREQLANRLREFIHDPQVEVQVSEYKSQRVFVAGQVRTPGAVPVTAVPLHITDALAQAGGALADADLSDVRLTRAGRRVTLDLDRLYYKGDPSANLLLQHGDVLTVPDRQNQKIFVLGEVIAPKSYVLRRGDVTLAEALADAGGPNAIAASTAHIYLLRLDDAGQPKVYHLDARQPAALLLAEALPVQAGDLIVVNPTAISLVSRLLNQFAPVLSEAILLRSLRR